MNFFSFIINTNIFISLAAVFFTMETQVQLGMKPQMHPYLFIIFFATIFEYNLHRLITIVRNPQALNNGKHNWVTNLTAFYVLVAASVIGFLCAVLMAKSAVLITLLPIGVLTLLYSLPVVRHKKILFRLREIPLVKIFVIAAVWAGATILLPIIQSGMSFSLWHVLGMLAERFIFVFAITIPFDIRDIATDKESGLKTIPLLIGEKRSLQVAGLALLLFGVLCILHCLHSSQAFLIPAFLISALSTFVFITSKKLQRLRYYHYFVLDGTMLLQGLLVCLFYYLHLSNPTPIN